MGRYPYAFRLVLGVLATEYQLLKNANLATDSVKQELYYAMKAYERLDLKGERFFHPSNENYQYPCELNGFFVGDDVNASFFRKYFNKDRSFSGIRDQARDSVFHSDWNYNYVENGKKGVCGNDRSGSIDHISHLFMGFSLIKRCFEDGDNYNGYRFKEKAIFYTDLITTRLKEHAYKVIIPNTDGCTAGNVGDAAYQQQGAAYLIAKAANWITDKNYENEVTNLDKILVNKLAYPYNANNWINGVHQEINGNRIDINGLKDKHNEKLFQLSFTSIFGAIGKPWVTGITGRSHYVPIKVPFLEVSTSNDCKMIYDCLYFPFGIKICANTPHCEWHTTAKWIDIEVPNYKYCLNIENSNVSVFALLNSLKLSSSVSDAILSTIDALMTIINLLTNVINSLTEAINDVGLASHCIPTLLVNLPNIDLGLNLTSYVLSDVYSNNRNVPEFYIFHLFINFYTKMSL
jgi:hypothetical protein